MSRKSSSKPYFEDIDDESMEYYPYRKNSKRKEVPQADIEDEKEVEEGGGDLPQTPDIKVELSRILTTLNADMSKTFKAKRKRIEQLTQVCFFL